MVYAVQGEKNSRKIHISLFENGIPWDVIPEGITLISYKKSDGHGGMYDTLENGQSAVSFDPDSANSLIIALSEQVLTTPGIVSLSVSFQFDDEILTTFKINLDVSENPGIDVAESVDYFSLSVAIDAAIKAAEAVSGYPSYIVDIEEAGGTYVLSEGFTFDEIFAAFEAGRIVFCRVMPDGAMIPLSKISESSSSFSGINGKTAYDININSSGRIDFSEMILSEGNTGGSGGGSVNSVNGVKPDGNGDVDLKPSAYDLKDGYSYTENVYISEDGTETLLTGQYYKCFDYIPVRNGISYTMYGCGYALYDGDNNFLSAVYEDTGINRMREFTPTENGFVRLTINCDDVAYARFCKTDEKHLEPCDYGTKPSPFFDPKIPCNVHLYGDSNSEGGVLDDSSKSWANRLGALITSMQSVIYNRHFCTFADKAKDNADYILRDTGSIRFTAYTDMIGVAASNVGEIAVYIDGQQKDSIVQDGDVTFRFDNYGTHTIELCGVSGVNSVSSIATKKQRTFENHAVFGSAASAYLPIVPKGNVAIVMYGTNDRMIRAGWFHRVIKDFVTRCKAYNVIPYVFTPIPPNTTGEESTEYYQSINDIIAQLPSDCLNVYKDLQLAEFFCGKSLYSDNLHLNELGHKVLYAVAASKLQLAPPMSELVPYFQSPYATIEYVDTAISNLSNVKYVEVTMNDGNSDLVDESVKSVFNAVDSNNTVILFRDSEDGIRIYYRLYKRRHDDNGAETLTFAHKSAALEQYVHLTMGGPLDGGQGNIGVGTAILSAADVGAIPAPVVAEIGQAMCVSEVDATGKPVAWEPANLPTGGSGGGLDAIIDFTTTEDTTEIRIPLDTEEMAEKLSNASDIHITLYIPRDTADTETTTKGTVEVGIYKGLKCIFATVTDAIQAPTTDYSNSVTTHIVVFSTAYSTTNQREPSPVLIAKKPDNSSASTYELKGCLLYDHKFGVGNYIYVKGSQNMPAGTQMIIGVRV